MTENIDQSVWINTRKEPLVTASRLAKGDIDVHIVDGVMGEAKVKDKTIVSEFVRRGHLGQEHYHAGLDLMELRKVRYGRLDAKSNFPCFLIGADTRLGKSIADEIYSTIIKNLSRRGVFDTESTVVWCMTTEAKRPLTDDLTQAIIHCFDELLVVLEKTVMEVKNNVA